MIDSSPPPSDQASIILSLKGFWIRRQRRFLMISSLAAVVLFLFYDFTHTTGSDVYNGEDLTQLHPYRYAIIVDAGSSGSRLFVYCIPYNTNLATSIPAISLCRDPEGKPLTKKVNPGLSSFANDPTGTKQYITNLFSFASENIPRQFHAITPVYVLATAGMRLLTQSEQKDIWKVVRSALSKDFGFKFLDPWAQTVSGLYEALYGWITVNYLLGNFADPPRPTVGMLDMGGASMQIAYEVPSDSQPPKDLILDFELSGKRTYRVYVMTFLGYGTQEAKSRYKTTLLHIAMEYSVYADLLKARFRPSTGYVRPPRLGNLTVELRYTLSGQEKFIISDPCLQPGLEDSLTVRDLTHSRTLAVSVGGASSQAEISFVGAGDLEACAALQMALLQKAQACALSPCSMNGVHQPPLDLAATPFYAMSEYWYTSADLGSVAAAAPQNSATYTYDTFKQLASAKCRTPWYKSLKEYRARNLDPAACAYKQSVCFKASWILNVLHSGFGFPKNDSQLHPVEKLAGIEVQWSLGAFIYYMQQPEFHQLLAQKPAAAFSSNLSTQEYSLHQVTAILLLLCFLCLSLAAYCIYCRKRSAPTTRQPPGSRGGLLRRLLGLGSPQTKYVAASAANGSGSLHLIEGGISSSGTSGGGVGGRKSGPTGGNYPYVKITSPSVQVNFRSSTSMPSFKDISGVVGGGSGSVVLTPSAKGSA